MYAATLTSKGQLTIPKQVRDALGLDTGDRVEFIVARDGSYRLAAVKASIQSLKECIPAPAAPVSAEDMHSAIKRCAARKFLGTRV